MDCLSFDPFSLQQDCLTASGVNIGGREIAHALVVAMVIIVIDELVDAGFEMATAGSSFSSIIGFLRFWAPWS
jgi:hypothetical protein